LADPAAPNLRWKAGLPGGYLLEVVMREITKDYYERLYQELTVKVAWKPLACTIAERIWSEQDLYQGAVNSLEGSAFHRVPWIFVALVHQMEAGGNFHRQILNGEFWNQKTSLWPSGLGPWASWRQAARDGLVFHLNEEDRWDGIADLGYQLERWNGLGYADRGLHSPYLVSGSEQGDGVGKFVRDGVYDPAASSKQVGAYVILKVLCEIFDPPLSRLGFIEGPTQPFCPPFPIIYDPDGSRRSLVVKRMQEHLNGMSDEFGLASPPLVVDGWAGQKTSALFEQVYGQPLVKR
jgi:lysozyme family protein